MRTARAQLQHLLRLHLLPRAAPFLVAVVRARPWIATLHIDAFALIAVHVFDLLHARFIPTIRFRVPREKRSADVQGRVPS